MPGPARLAVGSPKPSPRPRARAGFAPAELIQGVRLCGTDLGRPPTIAAYQRWAQQQEPRLPGPDTVVRLVGPWDEILTQAGFGSAAGRDGADVVLEDSARTRRAIAALRRFAKHAGVDGLDAADYEVAQGVSTRNYMLWRRDREPDAPHLATVQKSLGGGWSTALHAAGLASTAKRPTKTQQFPDRAILEALRDAATELQVGARLGLREYQAWRAAGPTTAAPTGRLIWERFGSWTAALAASGLIAHPQTANVPRALDALRVFLADDTTSATNPEGYLVWAAEQSDQQPQTRALIAEHGSWAAALRAAGAEEPVASSPGATWENSDMLDALRTWAQHPDTTFELCGADYQVWQKRQDREMPSDATIALRFGTWRRALAAAGLVKREDYRARFRPLAPDAIDNALREFAQSCPDPSRRSTGRYSTWRAAHAPWAPSKRTLAVTYGSWAAVRDELAKIDQRR